MIQLELDFDELFEESKLTPQAIDEDTVSLIKRRRRQLLVHSYIYYRLNTSIVSDDQYDKWAKELIALQKDYPEESKLADLYDEFKDFQMGDSFALPMDDPWIHDLAHRLLSYHKEHYA